MPVRFKQRPWFASLISTSIQQAMAYRYTTFISVVANALWVIVLYYVWNAVYADRGRLAGLSWDQMRTYILLAYALNTLISADSAQRMMLMIREGQIVVEMVRPVNYLRSQLAITIGGAMIEGLIGFGFLLSIGFVFLGLQLPTNSLYGALFVVSVALGFLTKFLIIFSIALLMFWIINNVGLTRVQSAVLNILGGVLIPIQLLPGWLATVAEWSPLRGIISTPLGIYLGQYSGGHLLWLITVQIIWLLLLWGFAEWAWPKAFRAVEVQGG